MNVYFRAVKNNQIDSANTLKGFNLDLNLRL